MATGIPKTQWKGKPLQQSPQTTRKRGATPDRQPSDISLSYAGKRPEAAILATSPALVRTLPTDSPRCPDSNRLYYGDNLPVLATLLADDTVRGHVRLVYIDPPFATNSVFQSRTQDDAYSDLLAGAHYIEYLRERLILLRELLAEDGSIYVHLDERMAFHIKIIMDEVFGQRNYRNWITRKKCNPKNFTRTTFGNVADYLLFYTKSDAYVWNRPYENWTNERADKEYQYIEDQTGRRYKKVPIHAPGVRAGETGKPWRGMTPPPGKHWQYTPATLDELDARGEIYWSPTGNPRRKVYLDQSGGVPVQDIWLDFKDAHNQNIQITGYPTEKNAELLARIVNTSSRPGDLVLDCFAGSGTFLAVAEQSGRRWIGVDNSAEAIATTLHRLKHGTKRMGDFVGRTEKAPASHHKQAYVAMPLFDTTTTQVSETIPIAAASNVPAIHHEPLTSLTMYVTEPYHGELDEVALRQQ